MGKVDLQVGQAFYGGTLFYCLFCQKNWSQTEVNTVPLPKRFHSEYRRKRHFLYLCPRCGGTCATAARHRKEYPETQGAMKLREHRRI